MYCISCDEEILTEYVDVGLRNFCHIECVKRLYKDQDFSMEYYEDEVYLEDGDGYGDEDEYATYGYDYGDDYENY